MSKFDVLKLDMFVVVFGTISLAIDLLCKF
jgi:hypothetical protein